MFELVYKIPIHRNKFLIEYISHRRRLNFFFLFWAGGFGLSAQVERLKQKQCEKILGQFVDAITITKSVASSTSFVLPMVTFTPSWILVRRSGAGLPRDLPLRKAHR
jgi:hypothetical protein